MLTDPVKIAALDPRPLAELVQIAREGVAAMRERNNRKPYNIDLFRTDDYKYMRTLFTAPRTYPPSWA